MNMYQKAVNQISFIDTYIYVEIKVFENFLMFNAFNEKTSEEI